MLENVIFQRKKGIKWILDPVVSRKSAFYAFSDNGCHNTLPFPIPYKIFFKPQVNESRFLLAWWIRPLASAFDMGLKT